MAGKVAKAQVPKFPMHDFNDATYLNNRPSGGWNMDEHEVLDQLKDQRFQKRVEVLEQLLITVRRNGGKLPFANLQPVFRGLGLALTDTNWDVRLKCIQLINEVIPQFGDGLDSCMSEVMGKLIPNIGESKITVRRAVIQTLHVYMKCTHHVPTLLRSIVYYGLDNDNPRVRKEAIVALPMLFTPEFARENFFEITQSLCRKLADSTVEDNLRDCSLTTLDKIRTLVGEREFGNYLHKLPTPLRKYYYQLTGQADPDGEMTSRSMNNGAQQTPRQGPPFSKATRVNGSTATSQQQANSYQAHYVDSYEFGIIPSHVMSQINDQENFKLRAKGVEELRNIMYDLNEVDNNLMPHMLSFISFLNNLLDDSNFKITTVTLEILCLLVEKLGKNVKQFLKPLSSTLTKRMGDNKIVVRQAVMKVATKMMQSYTPKPVLSVICENLQHRNSKVRQETLNIIIAAMLTFPSYAFDLPGVCRMVSPTLTDPKRQVRQAALECLSVIAQTMGPGRLQPLVQAVDQVELSSDGEGVMGAVQARLARRQLPKLNSEGLVEYATPIPSSASTRSPASFSTQGADVDWIMGGSARGLSRSDTMELESVTSSTCSTPTANTTDANGQSRPFVSAGKGRKKLPWEGDINGQADGPPKPRQTWSSDDSSDSMYNKKPIIKRRTAPTIGQSHEEPVQETSYKQIHLQKLKKTQSLKSSGFRNLDLALGNEKVDADADDLSPSIPQSPADDAKKGKEEDSPIPLKATLARSATRRPTKKVPPISSSERHSQRDDDVDSAYAASMESTREAESHIEMMNSLMSIRSSASKKKEKIIEQQSSSTLTSRSPSPDMLKESGVWSHASSQDSEYSFKKKSKKPEPSPFESRPKIPRESPFESKPKLARTGSYTNKKPGGTSVTDEDTVYVDYNPSSGVTFRENRNSDVQIVGKGYNEDGTSIDSKSLNGINKKANDKRRLTKGSVLSPLGVASMHSYGSLENDDEKSLTSPSPEGIGVVGIGMFENTNGVEHAITAGNSQSNDRNSKQPMKQDRKDFTSGVVGVGVNKQGSFDDPNMDIFDDVDEDHNGVRMSQRLSDTIAQKKKQLEEEQEREKIEREKKKQEHDEKLKKERERQQEKLRRLNTSESLGIESLSISGTAGSGSQTSIGSKRSSPSITPRKKSRPQMDGESSHPLSASSRSPLESDNPDDWKPYKDADLALRQAQKNMGQDEWETKCGGINSIRRLAVYHKDTLLANLHPVIVALLGEVKNLRSQVSRLAIVCVGDLFMQLTKNMDTDLDMVVRALLLKNGESNHFIREDTERALSAMVDAVTPQRALIALIAGGATHKSVQVRKTTAQFLLMVVHKMGPGRILSGIKDVTDRILPAIAQFSMDSTQDTRFYGRKMLHVLMTHQDFDKMLAKHLPANTHRNVKDIVETLKIKGIGDGPNETSSARGWRSSQGSRSSSVIRGNSANSETTPKRRSTVRADENTLEEIKELNALMSANDWRDRYKGITQLLGMCEENSSLVAQHIVKIFDKFLPRLQDPNSKVNLYALQVMLQVIPILNDALASVINIAVGNVSPNLSSKNREINQAAIDIISALIEHLDGALLIQPMANQAQSANARSKPHLVEKVAELASKVYLKKQKQVVLHVLPLLWHLLGATNSSGAVQGGSSGIRSATGKLVNALHQHMGSQLIERASSDPNVTPRHIQLLQELIEIDS